MNQLVRMSNRFAALIPALLAGCAAMPPERVERDRVILAAVQPCKERYAERLYNTNMMSVYPSGTVRFWYKGDLPKAADDVRGCIDEHTKGLRLGPWLPGRLTKAGPATIPITLSGKDVLVPVRVNGIPGTMVARAGADFTFLTSAYARSAGVRVVTESPTIRIRTDGKSVHTPYARAMSIEVGEVQVQAADVVVYEQVRDLPNVDGILGKPFLSQFKMDVDRANGRLTLQPARAAVSCSGCL